jgi:hypothetical protein
MVRTHLRHDGQAKQQRFWPFLLDPLAQAIAAHARSGGALHADDTPVPVLDPGRTNQDRPALGAGARRTALGFARSASRGLPLLGRPQRRARPGAARRVSRLSACRRLCRIQHAVRARSEDSHRTACRDRVLGACAAQALRRARRDHVADRTGSTGAHRPVVRHRGGDPRPGASSARWPSSTRSKPSWIASSPASAVRARWPRRSATACGAGTRSLASPRTAGWR